MMQEVEVLKTIQELICSFFSEEQFTLSGFALFLCYSFVYGILKVINADVLVRTYICLSLDEKHLNFGVIK